MSTDSLTAGNASGDNPVYNTIGLILAISSGLFIGASFIVKKKGLLKANALNNEEAGTGHAYLKSPLWWAGMLMMAFGELFNFAAYAFTAAIIVTPLGALSVVISAILASFILKEKLNTQGKIGCALCVVGAIIIVLHAPAESAVKDIPTFLRLVIQPAFLVYCGLVVISSSILIFWGMPRYGRTNMLVPIGICSIIGSVAVVFTQGFGAAIVYSITTASQFTHWFTYVTMVIMAISMALEINYLNVALNCFNTAMVTPVYYVTFTTATIVASAVLFQGFHASARDIFTVVLGFFVIVSGVALLQLSRGSANPAEITVPELAEILGPVEEDETAEAGTLEEGRVKRTGLGSSQPSSRNHSLGRRTGGRTVDRARTSLLLHESIEAGPWALRPNPLQTLFRRPVLIAEELVHEHQVQHSQSEEEDRVQRRHTVSGLMSSNPSDANAPIGMRSEPCRSPTIGSRVGNGTRGTGGIWSRVRTMYGDPRQTDEAEMDMTELTRGIPSPEGERGDLGSTRTVVVAADARDERRNWKEAK